MILQKLCMSQLLHIWIQNRQRDKMYTWLATKVFDNMPKSCQNQELKGQHKWMWLNFQTTFLSKLTLTHLNKAYRNTYHSAPRPKGYPYDIETQKAIKFMVMVCGTVHSDLFISNYHLLIFTAEPNLWYKIINYFVGRITPPSLDIPQILLTFYSIHA